MTSWNEYVVAALVLQDVNIFASGHAPERRRIR